MAEQQSAGDWMDTLRDAHRQYAGGAFAGAARLYEQVAQIAEQADLPTAYRLYLQAGRAALQAEGSFLGTELLLRGLKLLALDGQTRQLEKVGGMLVAELREQGQNQPAQRVVTWLASGGVSAEINPVAGSDPEGVRLPDHCPTCQGALPPEELGWLDGQTLRCPFCGYSISGETG